MSTGDSDMDTSEDVQGTPATLPTKSIPEVKGTWHPISQEQLCDPPISSVKTMFGCLEQWEQAWLWVFDDDDLLVPPGDGVDTIWGPPREGEEPDDEETSLTLLYHEGEHRPPVHNPPPSPFVLSFTPRPTYTLGRRQSSLTTSQDSRLRRPLHLDNTSHTPTVIETDRGGLTTYHGPGQIVLWPILDIHSRHHTQFTVRSYARLLETTTQAVLSRLEIPTYLSTADPGIWVTPGAPERKIAALGVHLRRHITGLGVALNIDVAVSGDETTNPWSRFVPCGLEGKAVTSIRQELGGTAWEDLVRQHKDAARLRQHIAESWVEELSRQIGTDAVRHKSVRESDLIPNLAP
ncbi:hypothetical protein B0T11DRAFT_347292 [Plectosphaerella cucumerina]|uniref:lipoyl(octanoyl) transferase n=1 Tax=Plectosphaerella cucumerina TaxID=40658 RepID=A0A8K0TR49_9PEZI|nr:hypothetical protein B0T11DRAFT_347292 [Plectosphaerella cucumerina]